MLFRSAGTPSQTLILSLYLILLSNRNIYVSTNPTVVIRGPQATSMDLTLPAIPSERIAVAALGTSPIDAHDHISLFYISRCGTPYLLFFRTVFLAVFAALAPFFPLLARHSPVRASI